MKRERSITIRVNDLEDERIKSMAEKRQKTVAEYLRWLVDRDEAAIAPVQGNSEADTIILPT
jgi:predicted DNA-binding protein